jgi:SAF domain-containing protein
MSDDGASKEPVTSHTSGCGPLSWTFLAAVVGVVVLAFVRPGVGSDRVRVLVTTRNVGRGEVLSSDDFALAKRHVRDPSTLAKDADGHVTRRALKAGSVIGVGDLGPDAFATLGPDLTLVAVHAAGSAPLEALLHPGDGVRVTVRVPGRGAQQTFAGIIAGVGPSSGASLDLGVLMSREEADKFIRRPPAAEASLVGDLAP